jgi:hypothetical protein
LLIILSFLPRGATTTFGVLGEDFVSYSYRRQIL